MLSVIIRLVFTGDGVVVVIRSVGRYNLVKIKPKESEAEQWFCLWLRRLRSSENCIVGVGSRSGRTKQSQGPMLNIVIGLFFHFCLRLLQPSFHWIISDRVVNGIRRNINDSDSVEVNYDSAYDSDFRFSLGHKLSYDSNSVTSENQPYGIISHLICIFYTFFKLKYLQNYYRYLQMVNSIFILSWNSIGKFITWRGIPR